MSSVGLQGPFGLDRVVFALPLANAALLEPALIMRDEAVNHPGDPALVVVGFPAVRVHRMLFAGPVQSTRRIP